jgi:5-hydroxyisourate hydrolase-like protein (transthyretin family)
MSKMYFLLALIFTAGFAMAQVSQQVTGTMVDQKTDEPIEELEIALRNVQTKEEFRVETNDDGVFNFKKIPLGTYEFHVTDRDYMDNPFKVEINEDHLKNFTFGTPITAALKVSWLFNWGDRTIKTESGKTVVLEHYWSHLVGKIVLTIYGLCLLLVFFYSVLQLSLSIAYVRNRKKKPANKPTYNPETTPKVTVQLPM